MIFDRAGYKESARQQLRGNWGAAMAVTVMATIFSILSSWLPELEQNMLFAVLSFVFYGPLIVAGACFFICVVQNKQATVNDFFSGLSYFVKAFLVETLKMIIIVIGIVLLIVPGIIASVGLLMTPYIVANNPKIGTIDALKLSWKMTYGHKMDLFVMLLSFIGWYFVAIFTLGFAMLYVHPYTEVAFINAYFALQKDCIERGEATYEAFGLTAPVAAAAYAAAAVPAQGIDAQQADYEAEFAEEEAMNGAQASQEENIDDLIGCIRDEDDDANYVPPSREEIAATAAQPAEDISDLIGCIKDNE